MKSHQIRRFAIPEGQTSDDYWADSTIILVKGTQRYSEVLVRAFPYLVWSEPYPTDTSAYDWYVVCNPTTELRSTIKAMLDALTVALFIEDSLTECFALAPHTEFTEEGVPQRTRVGQIVREAKPYDAGWNSGSKQQAAVLAAMMVDFVKIHPSLARAHLVASVPPSNPSKLFDLPALLAEEVAKNTNKQLANAGIQKTRATQPMKAVATLADKLANVKDAFTVDGTMFKDKDVVLIDDIYHTGATINEVGRSLRAAGATSVFGLTATKTIRNF